MQKCSIFLAVVYTGISSVKKRIILYMHFLFQVLLAVNRETKISTDLNFSQLFKPTKYYNTKIIKCRWVHIYYRQLDFSSQPGVAKEILENEPESVLNSCLVLWLIFKRFSKISCFERKIVQSEAQELLNFWSKSQAEG